MTIGRALGTALLVTTLGLVGSLVAGCSGFADDEATLRCDQEEQARGGGACFTNESYDQCIAAFTDCGDDTVIDDTACPVSYTCP